MDKNLEKNLENRTAISVETLLEKKGLIEKRLNAKVDIETSLGVFRFRVPTIDDIRDSQGFKLDGQDMESDMLLYSCGDEPNFRSQEMQKGFENDKNHPVEIIGKIFLPGEIETLASKLLNKAGYGRNSVKVMDEVKN